MPVHAEGRDAKLYLIKGCLFPVPWKKYAWQKPPQSRTWHWIELEGCKDLTLGPPPYHRKNGLFTTHGILCGLPSGCCWMLSVNEAVPSYVGWKYTLCLIAQGQVLSVPSPHPCLLASWSLPVTEKWAAPRISFSVDQLTQPTPSSCLLGFGWEEVDWGGSTGFW